MKCKCNLHIQTDFKSQAFASYGAVKRYPGTSMSTALITADSVIIERTGPSVSPCPTPFLLSAPGVRQRHTSYILTERVI